MEKLEIEYVPTESLRTYPNNAKIHTAEQIEQIKESIIEFGMNDPIAVWHGNEIIEGHGRLIACRELGIDTVPVIRLDSLTDDQRRAYMLVHNKLTMNTGFDFDVLNDELESLEAIDMTTFGFTLSESDFGLNEESYAEDEETAETSRKYALTVNCGDEVEQLDLYHKLLADGYDVKMKTS